MSENARYKLMVEYDGTEFVGWQIQQNGRSVQEVLEYSASHLFLTHTRVTGAGRTDSGVHAKAQVAHFDAATCLENKAIRAALNARLPKDVTVLSVERADPAFHARFSASSRLYEYFLSSERISLRRRYCWQVYGKLDHERISTTAGKVQGTRDFTAFSLASGRDGHNFCHVFEAAWSTDGRASCFAIRANRFLHGMVRALLGGLIQVGRGRLSTDEFMEILESRDRGRTPMLAPAHGLFLSEIRYEAGEFEEMKQLMSRLRAQHKSGCSG